MPHPQFPPQRACGQRNDTAEDSKAHALKPVYTRDHTIVGGDNDLEVSGGPGLAELLVQGLDAFILFHQLEHDKMQEGCFAIGPLHVRQLEQGVQLEPCAAVPPGK